MTEAEWETSDNIEHLLECLVSKRFPDAEPCNWGSGQRKKMLFISTCLRRLWHVLPIEYQAVTELLEAQAEGSKISDVDRERIWDAAEALNWNGTLLFAVGYDDIRLLCYETADMLPRTQRVVEPKNQSALLRDIFGNPFRPVAFSPEWRTSTVVALAQQMYESRDFSVMPILADALEDAGCDSADVLAHCRDPKAPHVRGCWVVDLVLGKE